jgi:hypothetical protein
MFASRLPDFGVESLYRGLFAGLVAPLCPAKRD